MHMGMNIASNRSATMAIFALKNVAGWRDQRYIDLDVPQFGPEQMAETMRVLADNGLSLPNQAIGAAVVGALEDGEGSDDAE